VSERLRPTAPFGGAPTLAMAVLFAAIAAVPQADAQSYSVVYSFCAQPNDGEAPYGGLIADSDGNLYGTTYLSGEFGYGTVFEVPANEEEKVLYSFAGPPNDGSKPVASLVRDAAGNLYGTTEYGGADDVGTAFELSTGGVETILHSFYNRRDGAYPRSQLLLGAPGELYGTTDAGGLSRGTIFQVSTSAKEHVLYSFGGVSGDGLTPGAGLIRDSAGNMYGTTEGGGAFGVGTVFEFGKPGAETVLYSFGGSPDGAEPTAGVVRDASGNLYGTTSEGGQATQCPSEVGVFQGCGTVFKLAPDGQETVLYTFTGASDGGIPYGGLVLDSKGNLYGTASQGGSSANCNDGATFVGCGVVFEITAAGEEKVLHSFEGGPTDGEVPYSGLVFGSRALYGTTFYGGAEGCGIVYKVSP
jgi:uncharacterized repeat protein (TIGR03803 family)